jgi:hypothetical protein
LSVGLSFIYFISARSSSGRFSMRGDRKSSGPLDGKPKFSQRVFSMTSAQGRENLIRRRMDRSGCDRTEAMRLAIEEWRRDNR